MAAIGIATMFPSAVWLYGRLNLHSMVALQLDHKDASQDAAGSKEL